jgi:molecular chaperone GrpE
VGVASKQTRRHDKADKSKAAEGSRPEQAPGPTAQDADEARAGTAAASQDQSDDASRTGPETADTTGSTTRDVGDPEEATQEDPVAALTRERDELQERLMRLAAEFDNFRKRTAREWQDHRKRANSDVLREIIELVDNFERALEAPVEDAAGLRKGVELIHQQLLASLRKFGVEDISAEGMEFDPQRHEALMMVDSDEVDSQHVVQVIQKGYALNGEVLRPARVTVSR